MATDGQPTTKGINPFALGMAGLLVGSAMGAAAVAFSDKKNREDAIHKLAQVKQNLNKWSDKVFLEAQKLSGKTKHEANKNVGEAKKEMDEVVQAMQENQVEE